ncbi:hypothetical protein ACWGID_09415 [Kribbella sp. NPDC054772]
MRADPAKRKKFARLREHTGYEHVVALSRAYLDAAVRDAQTSEKEYWSLSCLPGTRKERLAAISMKSMEVLVVGDVGEDIPEAFVVVSLDHLVREHGSAAAAEAAYQELDFDPSDYRDAGDDQVRVYGWAPELAEYLASASLGTAAQELAGRLMGAGKTMQWFGHNYQLADQVLGRATKDDE